MIRSGLILLTVSFTFLVLSCEKRETTPTQSTYSFVNKTEVPITLDLYGSAKDYGTNANRLQQYVIPANAVQKMVLDVGKRYWVDWYSDDYAHENWETSYSGSTPPPVLVVAMEDEERIISSLLRDTVRSVILPGGSISSRWKGQITDVATLNGSYEFIFRKDMGGEFTFTDTNGKAHPQAIQYSVIGVNYENEKTGRFVLYVRDANSKGLFTVRCDLWNFPHTGRDTLVFQGEDGFIKDFFLLRQ